MGAQVLEVQFGVEKEKWFETRGRRVKESRWSSESRYDGCIRYDVLFPLCQCNYPSLDHSYAMTEQASTSLPHFPSHRRREVLGSTSKFSILHPHRRSFMLSINSNQFDHFPSTCSYTYSISLHPDQSISSLSTILDHK